MFEAMQKKILTIKDSVVTYSTLFKAMQKTNKQTKKPLTIKDSVLTYSTLYQFC